MWIKCHFSKPLISKALMFKIQVGKMLHFLKALDLHMHILMAFDKCRRNEP